MAYKPRRKLRRLDRLAGLHICEPVLASTVAAPKGAIRAYLLRQLLDKLLPDNLIVKALTFGVERGVAAWRSRRADPNRIELYPRMYLAVGPTTAGLYTMPIGIGEGMIGHDVLYLPREAVLGCEVNLRPLFYKRLTLHIRDRGAVRLLVHFSYRKSLVHCASILQSQAGSSAAPTMPAPSAVVGASAGRPPTHIERGV